GVCKLQFDDLVLEAGTYTLSFYVGDADTNYLFYAVHTDPETGNHVGLTAIDPQNPVLPDMGSTSDSLIHQLDPGITANFSVSAVPGDGEWTQWAIEYTVPSDSPMLGRPLGFLFRKPSRNAAFETRSTGAFDGPLVLDFVPALTNAGPAFAADYTTAGSTATPGADYLPLPARLAEGTNSIIPVTDLIEEGGEQLVFSLAASSNYYISGSATAVVSVLDHPMDGWRAAQFGTNATNPAVAGDTANPDGDSNLNTMEWILATDPLAADSPFTSTTFNDPNWIITYTRRKIPGVSVYAEVASALAPPAWGTGAISYEGVIGVNGDVETVAVIVPFDLDQRFIQLQIEE
ncbi:hypothetical protein, partial [Pontiella sp.]|uniref:hypothetical protein n=1 Tax=Pontiella sp. TaxID=2837462 RepID=UPI00356A561B